MGEFTCRYCGSENFIDRVHTPHIGRYCADCGKWNMWVKKTSGTNVQRDESDKPLGDNTPNGFTGDVCHVCGGIEFVEKQTGPHVGRYCKGCGKWIGWVGKGKNKTSETAFSSKTTNDTVGKKRPAADLPAVVKGTERLKFFYAANGNLTLYLDDNMIPVLVAGGFDSEPKRIVIAVGEEKLEIPLGGSMEMYIV